MKATKLFIAAAVAALIGGVGAGVTPTEAIAQQSGEVRCQADGYLYRWAPLGDGGSWVPTFRQCPAPSRGDDRSDRRSDSGGRGDSYDRGASPVDGDEKCSPDGYVLRYRNYANGWVKMAARC